MARRILTGTPLNGLGRSARFAGFADSLLAALSELESGLLEPEQLEGDLGLLYAAYREELDRLGLWDRDLLRRRAVERLRSELDAWDGRPVFAYGFEDLTGAEWGLLEALSGRTEVTVSLPVRAGPRGLRVAAPNAGGSRRARGRADRGVPAPRRGVRPRGARAPGAPSLRRYAARRPCARRRHPVLRGCRVARVAGARLGGDPGARGERDAARGDRTRRSFARALACVPRDRARNARDPGRDRGPGPARPDRIRAGAARAAPLRVAPGRPPRPLRLPPLAVLRLHPLERRLSRGQAPRPRSLLAGGGRGGDDQASRRAAATRRSRRSAARSGRSRLSARSRPRCCAARTASRRRR